ncbi:MAG: hypothetical protein HQ503_08145 [Rhodospirillales bacterium]|nr:hypothetical protein [Rhodospirillales bacterium]
MKQKNAIQAIEDCSLAVTLFPEVKSLRQKRLAAYAALYQTPPTKRDRLIDDFLNNQNRPDESVTVH